MEEGTRDRWRHQEPSSMDKGGPNMDGSFSFRDNRAFDVASNAASKITGRHHVKQHNGTTEPSVGYVPITNTANGYGNGLHVNSLDDKLEVVCGPLLNYKHMSNDDLGALTWYGSVLVVAKPGQTQPTLKLRCIGPAGRDTQSGSRLPNARHPDHGKQEGSNGTSLEESHVPGVKLYADSVKAFWRFAIHLPLQEREARWEYSIADVRFVSGASSRTSSARTFAVPAASQSMRIMFHSCNGFSIGTDEDAWSGLALWNDVLRVHDQEPFHVMIGGGDQIYNDGVRVGGPLRPWTDIGNPHKRRDFQFGEELRAECDQYYYDNYVKWFSTEPFASANGRIPQVNIWDDHDIIDGFGSYTDHFMKCAVFRGIGGISFKYYCLFQHHIAPPKSTFTTDSPQTMHSQGASGAGADPAQLLNTFVLEEKQEDPSYIIGNRPGPYVEERSRSLYMRLGARLAFLGIDARTERSRHQVNYPETYDLIFQRVRSGMSSASSISHLIVLLGVPIAYPRLAWLESIFTSPIIGPVRFLSKRFGVAGGLFNHFDGQVDLLDDLDDHYTARQHKKERKDLTLRLQALAEEYNIRITILGGDVHLAALGRFYSNPKLNIPVEQDHRYMANVVSSAITNKPPPQAIANFLARRNKIHHLDRSTDETLMKLFDKDPGSTQKTATSNHVTMPSRNYAIITESPSSESTFTNDTANGHVPGDQPHISSPPKVSGTIKDGHSPLHAGEEGAGTKHVAASGVHRGTMQGGLDVCFRVEIDQHDREGKTEGYGFSIPALRAKAF